jgi:hypothetical protein
VYDLRRITLALVFLSLLAGKCLPIDICEVQRYDPRTGFSPYFDPGEPVTVTLTGVITVPAGIFVEGESSMYMRGLGEDVCGINVFAFGQAGGGLELGDTITVTGEIVEYVSTSGYGATTEIMFVEGGLTNIRKADTAYVEPVVMRTGEVGREENEGRLVRVTGKVVTRQSDEITLNDGSGSIVVFDMGDEFGGDPVWRDLSFGDEVTITGIVAQSDPEIPYLHEYRIWPRRPDPPFEDVVIPKCEPDTVIDRAVLRILDAEDNEVGIFCPECPGSADRVYIVFNAPHTWRTRLRVFDCYGRESATLSDYFTLCGARVYEWDGRNELRERLPIGLYNVVITAIDPGTGEESQTSAPIVIGRRLR